MPIFFQVPKVKKYATKTLPYMLSKFESQVGEKGFFVADQVIKITMYTYMCITGGACFWVKTSIF